MNRLGSTGFRAVGPAVFAATVMLAGCGDADEPVVESEVVEERAGDAETLEPGETSLADPAHGSVTAPAAGSSATAIPAAIQGRWGLVPADCTSQRGDAKGLLTITGNELQFYESVGTLQTVQERDADRLRASFAFEGEGMTWQRDMVLDVQDGGETLIRRELGGEASPAPFRYRRCA